MSNLTRPPAAATTLPSSAHAPRDLAADLLDDLRLARTGSPALPGLPPATYARTHAAFELLSDQRRLITSDLVGRVGRRSTGPVSVLSAGCGDGTLDAPLAETLAGAVPARPVRYVGVDPFPGSTAAFTAALSDLDQPTLTTEVHTVPFDELSVVGEFDVVTFVHSMYYVRDVAQTLRSAYAMLRPGGELLVLSAPRAELNALVEVLAPPAEGHDQWFSEDVALALLETGLPTEAVETLHAGFDAEEAGDEVLDFAVQAALTPELRPLVRAYLDAIAVPTASSGTARRVPHPVDVYRVVRPA